MGSWRWQSRGSNKVLVTGPSSSNDSSSSTYCCYTGGFLVGRAHVERSGTSASRVPRNALFLSCDDCSSYRVECRLTAIRVKTIEADEGDGGGQLTKRQCQRSLRRKVSTTGVVRHAPRVRRDSRAIDNHDRSHQVCVKPVIKSIIDGRRGACGRHL